MIKHINHQNVSTTPFRAKKAWELDNVHNPDAIILEHYSASVEIPDTEIALEYIDYSSGTPILNTSCNIALEQQDEDAAIYEEGISGSNAHFDPATYEQNLNTGTYKTLLYDQMSRAFYNYYRNPIEILGMENIDFPLSKTNRFLNDRFKMFTIPRIIMGDKLVPGSIQLQDTSFDDNVHIQDDSNGNLVAGNYLFSKVQEVRVLGNMVLNGSASYMCPAYYVNPPTPPFTGSIIAWWPFDDSPAGPWYDAVSGSMYFVNSVVAPQTTGSGKVGHALQMITNGESVTIPVATSSIDLVYTSSGFTITTWFKIDASGSTVLHYDGYNAITTALFGATRQVDFSVYLGLNTNQWQVQFYTVDDNFSSPTVTELFPYTPVIGEWHLFRFSYDYSNGKIIYQIDTGSRQTGVSIYQYFNSASISGRIWMRQDPSGFGDSNVSWDELNFSNNVLSDADVAYLYNSGAGRTWPVTLP